MLIRDAESGDSEAIAELLGQLGYPASADAVLARLARISAEPGQYVLLAQDGERVVGLATVIVRHVIHDDAPFARLAALVVADDRWNEGVGRSLVARAEELARQAGCNAIEVTSGDHRPQAHAFYRRLGFEERPRRFIKRL